MVLIEVTGRILQMTVQLIAGKPICTGVQVQCQEDFAKR